MIWGSQLVVCCAVLIGASGGLTRRESEANGDANYYYYNYVPNNQGPPIYSDIGYQVYSSVPDNQGPPIYSDYQDYSSVPDNQGPPIYFDYQDYSSVPTQGPVFPSDSNYPNTVIQNTPTGPDNLAYDSLNVKSFVYFGSQAQNEKTRMTQKTQSKNAKTKVKVNTQSQQGRDTNVGTALKTIGRNLGKTIKKLLNPSKRNKSRNQKSQ